MILRLFSKGVDLEKLKEWYNGYCFLKDKVYNPFDILLFIRNKFLYKNYWFETGTPSFLLKLIKQKNYYLPDLENIVVGEELLNSFNINDINIEALLFQSGYLTIKEMSVNPVDEISYSLVIPNKEVRLSLNGAILRMFNPDNTRLQPDRIKAMTALIEGKPENFRDALVSFFSSVPYENYNKNNIAGYEGFYASVLYTYLSSFCHKVTVEESTSRGKLDMSILLNDNRYVFEFKVGGKDALQQIKDKKYYEKFLDEGSRIYLVGINFDEEKRNISGFEWEKIK